MKTKINIGRRLFLALGLTSLIPMHWAVKNVFGKEQTAPAKNAVGAGDAHARMGINLSDVKDWSSEFIFVDVFPRAREWISQKRGADWGKGPALELDEHGWIKRLEDNCFATTFVSSNIGKHCPSGEYTVLYDGEGELEFSIGSIFKKTPGRLLMNINTGKGDFRIDVTKTNPKNPLRNIRVIMPGFEATYPQNPWHPDFLKLWSGSACIRLMDLMGTNGSTQKEWSGRPQINDAGYAKKGVPLELLIDLANRLKTDPWFCIPHQADDEYVRQFAAMVKEKLNPNLRAWVEYSNELWNGQFEQSDYVGKEGQRLGFAKQPWEAGWRYTAYRSKEIFAIWEDVFGGHERFVRVLPSQAANSYVSEQILEFESAAKHADVLAIAPYMTLLVSPSGDYGVPEAKVAKWNLDQLFDYLLNHTLSESAQWVAANKKVADKHGLKLVAYEGGQHLVGISGAENNEKIEQLFLKANTDKRMGELYTQYLDSWQKQGGDLFCLFNSVSEWSKWGSWGLLQHQDDPANSSPKYLAAIQWAIAHGQPMQLK
jgi:hypothetical protein